MIPDFPNFSPLKLEHQPEIENITRQFPPYSDFNFVSLYCYDSDQKVKVSLLHGNLVIQFPDYLTNEMFYTFIGTNRVKETIGTLLKETQKLGTSQFLNLIPQETVRDLLPSTQEFSITEDIDNHDHLLDPQVLATYPGNKFGAKRNFVNRFTNNYLDNTKIVAIEKMDSSLQEQIINVFASWEKSQSRDHKDTERELHAIQKMFTGIHKFNLHFVGVYIKDKLVAFSIQEEVGNGWAMLHFEKADVNFVGIFPFLKQQVAREMLKRGVKIINYEQDLGLPGLRKAKLTYSSGNYLKKWKVGPLPG